MLVKMAISDEPNLMLLNEKNQAFTRVAKYHKFKDYMVVLLFSSYRFGESVDEVYSRY